MVKRSSAMDSVKLGSKSGGKRIFLYETYRRGVGFTSKSMRYVRSDMNIRAVACILFRKIYGNSPSVSWGIKGSMGEAFDNRGYSVMVSQVNRDDRDYFWKQLTSHP